MLDSARRKVPLPALARWLSLLQHDWARGYAERPGVTVVDNAGHVFDGLQRLAAQSAESTELVWA